MGCVLYVLGRTNKVSYSDIAKAQQTALQQKVPMAVVYCMAQWDTQALETLRPAEQSLSVLNIPLIILIGEPQKTLAGIVYHTKPLLVFYQQDDGVGGSVELIEHTYSWPGKVLTIPELVTLASEGNLFC